MVAAVRGLKSPLLEQAYWSCFRSDSSLMIEDFAYRTLKRTIDLFLALAALVVGLPLLVAVAIAVKASSPGPVIYKGVRSGLRGKPFLIYKFRTMQVGSDAGSGTTSRNDSRVTEVGRFLRKFKLDELPQLFNVVRGEMSLVGPRPELPKYTERYVGDERQILNVLPGITDFSSIEYSDLNERIADDNPEKEFEEKILPHKNRLRLKYVQTRSLSVDAMLIVKTISKLIGWKSRN